METLWIGFKRSVENEENRKKTDEQLIRDLNTSLSLKGNLVSLVLAVDNDSGKAVGYGSLERPSFVMVQYAQAYVDPGHRRRGIFGNITEEIMEVARRNGVDPVTARVSGEITPTTLFKRKFEVSNVFRGYYERRV